MITNIRHIFLLYKMQKVSEWNPYLLIKILLTNCQYYKLVKYNTLVRIYTAVFYLQSNMIQLLQIYKTIFCYKVNMIQSWGFTLRHYLFCSWAFSIENWGKVISFISCLMMENGFVLYMLLYDILCCSIWHIPLNLGKALT